MQCTAINGFCAANGAILITTKKGNDWQEENKKVPGKNPGRSIHKPAFSRNS